MLAALTVLFGLTALSTYGQGTSTADTYQPIRLLPLIISPAERQLPAVLDSANRYKQLYHSERKISALYQVADGISNRRYVAADSAYQAQRKQTAIRAQELETCNQSRSAVERDFKQYVADHPAPTKVGRVLRTVRDGLAVVGAVLLGALILH